MKESIGGVMIIDIIVVFMIIVFGLLAATFSYTKAYKVNTRIINGIEIFEGYNNKTIDYINKYLDSLGYNRSAKTNCATTIRLNNRDGVLVNTGSESFYYCVYYFDEQVSGNCYYSYAVVTYIGFDLPLVNRIEVPVTSKSNRIFNFDKTAHSQCSR